MIARTTTVTVLIALGLAGPAAADFRMERRVALQPGGLFTLESDIGSVTITGGADRDAVVTVTADADDFASRFDVTVSEDRGRARITLKRRGGWRSRGDRFRRDDDVQIVVRLPRRSDVVARTSGGSVRASGIDGETRLHTSGGSLDVADIGGTLDVESSGGSVSVRRVRGGVDARTSGGSVSVSDVRGNLTAVTSGGSVTIEDVSGDVRTSSSGGSVRVREAGGRVEARTSGGGLTVAFARGNGHGGVLSASGGGVVTELDPSVALSIDAVASGGSVSSELSTGNRRTRSWRGGDEERELQAELNGGGPLLQIRSSGAGIHINRASVR